MKHFNGTVSLFSSHEMITRTIVLYKHSRDEMTCCIIDDDDTDITLRYVFQGID